MGAREKPLHINSIICLTLKGMGTISARKAVTFVTVEEKQMVHIRKQLCRNPILLSPLKPAVYHSIYFKGLLSPSFMASVLTTAGRK